MNIRTFRPDDQGEVIRLWADCGLVVPHNNPIRDIERKSKMNPEWFLVGENNGRIIASCMAGYEGHRGWINYLAVAPSEQRKGHATDIMNEAEKLLRTAGCPKINLQVRAENGAVIQFYQSIGFTLENVVSMGKRLEPDAPHATHATSSRERTMFMTRESINPWDWGLKWSMDQAEVITAVTRHLHCSGQVSLRPDPGSELGIKVVSPHDLRGQMECALANVDAVLEKAGMTRRNILNLRFFTTDIDGFLENYDVYAGWIAGAGIRPPQSLLGVERLVMPELMVEIEATAGE